MSQQQSVEEQEVRDLIAGAGPRPPVPAEDVAQIKAAVREEWREMVERRRRGLRLRGGLALAAGIVLALAVGWWWATRTPPPAAPVVASVELLAGSARVAGAELTVGAELTAGVLVETAATVEGAPAGAALRLGGQQSLRLAAATAVRLHSARRFGLERGALYLDSGAATVGGGVEVITALGSVRDIGTQFEVRLGDDDATLRVRVREGQVEIETIDERHLANQGHQLRLLGDGSVERVEIEPYGPEWEWVMATAPGIDIEGRSLAEVLSWVEREMGRGVRYADPNLEALAGEAVLSGPSKGLTPTELLDAVLQTEGLRYKLEDGTILIGR